MTTSAACDFAACTEAATSTAGGWAFCTRHAEDDKKMRSHLEPSGERMPAELLDQRAQGHGTAARAQQHRRAGQEPCDACQQAETLAKYDTRARQRLTTGSSTPEVSTRITELPVRVLAEHPENVRTDLGDLRDITASVEAQGVLQPLLVTRGEHGQYVIIAGHRRLAAALAVGLPRLPVVLRERLVGTDAIEAMLVENLQRAALDPIDEAEAYSKLIAAGRTQAQIARATGRPQGTISARLALLNLSPAEREAVRRREITVDAGYRAGRERSSRRMQGEQRRPKPKRVPHFTVDHPLANHARQACTHETTLKLGPACGTCWENAIRADERTHQATTADYCQGCGAHADDAHRAGCPDGEGCPVSDPDCLSADDQTHDACQSQKAVA